MQMGVWTEEDYCKKGVVGGSRINDVGEDGAEEGVDVRWVFTVLFYKIILTSHFFVPFKSRKAKDKGNNHGSREMEDNGMDDVGRDKVEDEDDDR